MEWVTETCKYETAIYMNKKYEAYCNVLLFIWSDVGPELFLILIEPAQLKESTK